MGRHSRVSALQRVELWRRYQAGETVLGIAGALGQRFTSNIYRVLEASGGIAPVQRRRSSRVLRLVRSVSFDPTQLKLVLDGLAPARAMSPPDG